MGVACRQELLLAQTILVIEQTTRLSRRWRIRSWVRSITRATMFNPTMLAPISTPTMQAKAVHPLSISARSSPHPMMSRTHKASSDLIVMGIQARAPCPVTTLKACCKSTNRWCSKLSIPKAQSWISSASKDHFQLTTHMPSPSLINSTRSLSKSHRSSTWCHRMMRRPTNPILTDTRSRTWQRTPITSTRHTLCHKTLIRSRPPSATTTQQSVMNRKFTLIRADLSK